MTKFSAIFLLHKPNNGHDERISSPRLAKFRHLFQSVQRCMISLSIAQMLAIGGGKVVAP